MYIYNINHGETNSSGLTLLFKISFQSNFDFKKCFEKNEMFEKF